MIRPSSTAFACAIVTAIVTAGVTFSLPAAAVAEPAVPAAAASPSPAPSAAPNPIGPALGNNDPCTSLSAIVSRPTVTNSVCTVRPNHVLVETGYQNTTVPNAGNTVVYPQSFIRVGTSIPALELDVTPPSLARANAAGVRTTGSTDAGVGLKYVFGYTPKFNYGAQIFVSAPTGINGFSAGGTQATYALQAGYTLNSVFSLTTGGQLQSLNNGTQRWSSFVPSIVLGASLPNSTSLFAEIAAFSHAIGPGTPTRTQYIFGAYHDVGPRLQIDLETGFSPTASTGKYHYVGAGLSYYL